MIVVRIIGILAAVALPAYQDYTVRAKMSEVMLARVRAARALPETYQTGGTPPVANGWAVRPRATRYTASVQTDANGVITVKLGRASTPLSTASWSRCPVCRHQRCAIGSMMGSGVNKWVAAARAPASR